MAETAKLEGALLGTVRYLVRGKWFRDAMLCGCLCVAVDGTLCERKRGSGLSDIEKRRHALEARMPRLMASRCPAEWLRML